MQFYRHWLVGSSWDAATKINDFEYLQWIQYGHRIWISSPLWSGSLSTSSSSAHSVNVCLALWAVDKRNKAWDRFCWSTRKLQFFWPRSFVFFSSYFSGFVNSSFILLLLCFLGLSSVTYVFCLLCLFLFTDFARPTDHVCILMLVFKSCDVGRIRLILFYFRPCMQSVVDIGQR